MNSEERTQQLNETERFTFMAFIVTAPLIYGIFWYVGILDARVSEQRRANDQPAHRLHTETTAERTDAQKT